LDGKLDIAAVCNDTLGDGKLSLLLGNGDGTFQPSMNMPIPFDSYALADANQDGKADLLGRYGLMLGNGDGTFRAGVRPPINNAALGDFNGDAIPDLAGYGPAIALGTGNGTFQPYSNPYQADSANLIKVIDL